MLDIILGIISVILGIVILVSPIPTIARLVLCGVIVVVFEFISRKGGTPND